MLQCSLSQFLSLIVLGIIELMVAEEAVAANKANAGTKLINNLKLGRYNKSASSHLANP